MATKKPTKNSSPKDSVKKPNSKETEEKSDVVHFPEWAWIAPPSV